MYKVPFERAQSLRSYVLLSGGIDSGTCLAIAKDYHDKNGGEVIAVSMDYGQRHIKETLCAKALCAHYGIDHQILDIRGALGHNSMLTDATQEVPDISYDQIQGISPTYVPFRNGFMLARLAAYAQEYVMSVNVGLGADHTGNNNQEFLKDLVTLYIGTHAEDAKNWAYPDCTPEFIGAMTNAIYTGTYYAVRLLAPLLYSSKDAIISRGTSLDVPYALTWSCYKGEELHCGTCPTCRARKEAFMQAGIIDPTEYAA